MIKCAECGFENAADSMFCGACGKKLTIKCTACGNELTTGFSFCPKCGTRIKTDDVAEKASSILNDSVVAGDVSIDASVHNVTNNYSTVNQVFNDSLVQCHRCDKKIVKGSHDAHTCPHCNNIFCTEHFNANANMCENCWDKAFDLMLNKHFTEAEKIYSQAIANGAHEADVYYYTAICMLNGKKAFVQKEANIKKIIEYMEIAIENNPKGIYRYFLSYIKYDYYARKYLNITPDYKAELRMAEIEGVTYSEIEAMYSLIGVARPSRL